MMEKEIIIASRYHVIRKIGEGGMAKVYLAYDKQTDAHVAMKILRKENIDERKVRHFKREAKTLSLLDDENIVAVYDVGEENGIHYIVNEFVEGMTLKEYINTCSPIPVEEVVELTRQILHGLAHAHSKGVVHKDIKSQNILLNENRDVKITDFGIADIMDEEITKTQSLMGTPQYVAPEILNRDELTSQSDIYSVGILIYEMLVSKAPFTGDKPAVIMIKQMNHPLPSIIAHRPDVPQRLENIAIKAAAKKLNNRYKTVEEVLLDLDEVFVKDDLTVKLVLENDLSDGKKLEKTIMLNNELEYNNQINENNVISKPEKKLSKMTKTLIGIVIIIGLLVVASLIYDNRTVVLPNFVNKNINKVEEDNQLENHQIAIIYQKSDTIAKNHIIKTEPPTGTRVGKNEEVIFTVSSGGDDEKIDNYVGAQVDTAKDELEAKGYSVEVQKVDSTEPEGAIVEQYPYANNLISANEVVKLKVSKGSGSTAVPNFIGLDLKEASSWANEYNIMIKLEETCNDTFDKDVIIKQSPKYNEDIQAKDNLKLTVSTGQCN